MEYTGYARRGLHRLQRLLGGLAKRFCPLPYWLPERDSQANAWPVK